jgi:Ca2+-binding EF-hand superfamily protein
MKKLKLNITASSVFITLFLVSCGSSHKFTHWDTSGNSKLDRSEFNKALDAADIFKSADKDNNNVISKAEWNDYLNANNYKKKYDSDEIGAFKGWDVNGNNKLSKWEFYRGIFNMADTGSKDDNAHDGYIEREEFDHWRNPHTF